MDLTLGKTHAKKHMNVKLLQVDTNDAFERKNGINASVLRIQAQKETAKMKINFLCQILPKRVYVNYKSLDKSLTKTLVNGNCNAITMKIIVTNVPNNYF